VTGRPTSDDNFPRAPIPDAGRARAPRAPRELETHSLIVDGVELLVLSFPSAPAELPAELSAAEREVVHWLLRGDSNAQVAARRRTAVRTAANQIASIFRKIGVGSRAELVVRLGSR
jgi:DNA-binding CsgD family transcriptional regulator